MGVENEGLTAIDDECNIEAIRIVTVRIKEQRERFIRQGVST